MIAALRYEAVRVLTVRATWICLIIVLVGVAGLAYLASNPVMLSGADDGQGEAVVMWWAAFSQPLVLTAILASVVASQNLGQEYRFGLIRLTLTAFPQRSRILLAKAASVVVVALAFTAVSYAASWIGVTVHGYPMPPDATPAVDSTVLLRGAVFVVLWSLSAWAMAGITRQTGIGIAVPIVSGLIVEQILGELLHDKAAWLVDILPWSTAARWATAAVPDDAPEFVSHAPVGWMALTVFGGWVLAFVVLETVSFLRRDA